MRNINHNFRNNKLLSKKRNNKKQMKYKIIKINRWCLRFKENRKIMIKKTKFKKQHLHKAKKWKIIINYNKVKK